MNNGPSQPFPYFDNADLADAIAWAQSKNPRDEGHPLSKHLASLLAIQLERANMPSPAACPVDPENLRLLALEGGIRSAVKRSELAVAREEFPATILDNLYGDLKALLPKD